MKYKRIILKMSGEVLGGSKACGIDPTSLAYTVGEVKKAVDKGAEIGIVIGGGNIVRGNDLLKSGFANKIKGDYMGMLATVINAIAIHSALQERGVKAKLITAFKVDKVGELFNQDKVLEYLQQGYVLVFAGGTSNPLFTTDSAAALRAVEIKADALLKATKVDGVYSADPVLNPDAERYDSISFDDVIKQELKVMDLTAFTICKENNMSVIVYNTAVENNLLRVLEKGDIGTLVF